MQQQQLNMMLGEILNLSYFDACYMVGSGLYSIAFRSLAYRPLPIPAFHLWDIDKDDKWTSEAL